LRKGKRLDVWKEKGEKGSDGRCERPGKEGREKIGYRKGWGVVGVGVKQEERTSETTIESSQERKKVSKKLRKLTGKGLRDKEWGGTTNLGGRGNKCR